MGARQELAQRAVSLSRRTRWMVWREDSTTKLRQSREPGGAFAGPATSGRTSLARAGIMRGAYVAASGPQ